MEGHTLASERLPSNSMTHPRIGGKVLHSLDRPELVFRKASVSRTGMPFLVLLPIGREHLFQSVLTMA